jgi:hypothetical protein
MGNNPSSNAKSGGHHTPSSSETPSSGVESPRSHQHHHVLPHHRKDARNIIPAHTTHRSVVPPEASLAQAHGSTSTTASAAAAGNRPKSLPSTAVSSLSGSPHSGVSAALPPTQQQQQQQQVPKAAVPQPPMDEPTKPVDVPFESSSLRSHHSAHAPALMDEGGMPTDSISQLVSHNSIADMYLAHPPRLPLPIEEEVHTPGSPIMGPQDAGPIPDMDMSDRGESSDGMVRKGSGLSAATADDEDAQELLVDKTRPVVPTVLEWKRGGEKVWVTGTIFSWNKKRRLKPVEGKPGCFRATIDILPGTHHVRFLVDGVMQTSPDLPLTVDFGNNLVNYIEVNPDDVPSTEDQSTAAPSSDANAAASGDGQGEDSQAAAQAQDPARTPKGKAVLPPEAYRSEIPAYLLDFDQAEESAAYQNAVAAIEKLPTPPSLPGFLAKPILNAATLMKDDNSVLNMPNHTVLNHLATSSIKNNMLAVSATTRYRNKYVTTIMYKPTSTSEG